MAKLHDLRSPNGAKKDKKRLGRGPGSGTGKTAGRGHKGQKARTGHHAVPVWFEGGQMPIQRRLPKRGFTNLFRTEFEIVNLRDLERVSEDVITPEVLHQYGLVNLNRGNPVKLLAEGELERKLTVKVHKASAQARAKVEAAGGTLEILE